MYGRGGGRGRGRGIPINYPDGWAAKTSTDGVPVIGELPAALLLTPADKEMLTYQRQLRQSSAFTAFRVADSQTSSDVARYSDRYRATARGPFRKSEYFSLHTGLHYTKELDPDTTSKRTSAASPGSNAPSRCRS